MKRREDGRRWVGKGGEGVEIGGGGRIEGKRGEGLNRGKEVEYGGGGGGEWGVEQGRGELNRKRVGRIEGKGGGVE